MTMPVISVLHGCMLQKLDTPMLVKVLRLKNPFSSFRVVMSSCKFKNQSTAVVPIYKYTCRYMDLAPVRYILYSNGAYIVFKEEKYSFSL